MEREHIYLVELVHAWARGQDAGAVPAPPAGLSWPRFGRLLADHLVVGALAPALRAAPLPEDVRAQLEAAARGQGRRGAMQLLELQRALQSLEAADCAPIALKGAALALTLYPAPEQRAFQDLDLLVPRERLERALEALGDLGCRPVETGRARAFYERHHFHLPLRGPAGVLIELHWALTLPASCYRFDLEGLRARAQTVRIGAGAAAGGGGFDLRCPSPRDQLLHAVMQCIADGYADLRRVMDTVLLLRDLDRQGREEMEALAAQAHTHGAARGLWMLLRQTELAAGVPMPGLLAAALRPPAPVRRALGGLDPLRLCLTRRATGRPHVSELLHWLCAPGGRVAWREIARSLIPSEASLLDAGYAPDALPGAGRRARAAAYRLLVALRAGGLLAVALALGAGPGEAKRALIRNA